MGKLKETTISEPVWEGKAHLTRREAAAFLGVGLETFRQWAKLYRVKRMKRGHVVRYPVAQVMWLRDRLTEREQ